MILVDRHHLHKFEECLDGRFLKCLFCGVIVNNDKRLCPTGAELHHRSCLLRKGGGRCTCEAI